MCVFVLLLPCIILNLSCSGLFHAVSDNKCGGFYVLFDVFVKRQGASALFSAASVLFLGVFALS